MPTILISDNATRDFAGCDDTNNSEDVPTTNKGSDTSMSVYSWAIGDNGRIFLRFSGIPSVPNAVVSAATIELYQVSANAGTRTIDVYRCLRSWVETELTWNIYSTGNNWTTAGGTGAGTDYDNTLLGSATIDNTTAVYKSWTLDAAGLAVVQAWMRGDYTNNGFMLIRNPSNAHDTTANNFNTGENAGDTVRPKLTVTYTEGSPRIIVPTIAVQMR